MAHAQPAPIPETEFFRSAGIYVTDRRIVFPGETYVMSNVSSVRLTKQSPSRLLEIVIFIAGAGYSLRGYNMNFPDELALGVGIIAFGLLVWIMRKTKYIVTLGAAGGERKAFQSKDKALVLEIIDGINRAIVER